MGSFSISLNQKLSQSLKLTPQLQQSIKLLQLGRADLIEQIQNELLENPVLEVKESENAELEREERREFYSSIRNQKFSGDPDSNRQFIENTATAREGLISHLVWQLQLKDLTEEELEIAIEIIGDLNKDGYLASSIVEIAELHNKPSSLVEEVLKEVQLLEPVGIAARDLSECLYLQLEANGRSNSLAAVLAKSFLEQLQQKKYLEICKTLNVTNSELADAISEIQQLDPRPGREFTEDETIYITPDVYTFKLDGHWVVSVNDSDIPDLELNKDYQAMHQDLDAKINSEARKYLNNNIKNALWLIKSIEQRAATIQRVSESVLRYQRDFFETGDFSSLKPLVLKNVADDLGLHESTISRATSHKYINTPHGTFELKFFFSSGFSKLNGNQVSSECVKVKIKELIDAENPKKPLSDQRIVSCLENQGIKLARRTVAKYREALGIESSSKRKQIF